MQYILRAMGIKQAETRFKRMGVAAIAAKPAMEAVTNRLMRIVDQTFESEGRRGGGSWKQDTEEWLLRKQRNNLDPRIGHATLALRKSLTEIGAPHQIRRVEHNFAELGSSLPYAETQQRHRPFLKLTKADKIGLRTIIRDWLIEAWRAPVA